MDTKALRQKILDLAIRGKLVPQDPNDEPASALLEHVRAEKQQMVKDGKLKPKDIKNDTIIFKGEDNLHYEQFQDGTVKCIEDEVPFDVPNGWAWCRITAVSSEIFAGGDKPDVFSKDKTSSCCIPIYSNGIENNGLYGYTNTARVLSPSLTISARGTIGFCCIREEPFVPIVRLITIVPADIDLLYLKFVFEALIETGEGSSIPQLTVPGIKPKLIPVSPLKEQVRIASKVNDLFNILAEIENNKNELITIIASAKSKILDLAIRGKLVPQDPNDEPASVLLERIRAEKEELIKQGKIKRDKKKSVIFKGEDNSYYEKISAGEVKCINDELPFELPKDWAWARLKSICEPISDGTHQTPKYTEDGYIFLSSKNVTSGYIDWKNVMYIPESLHDELYKRISPQKGDILLAKNGTTGVAALVDRDYIFDIYVTLALIRTIGYQIHPRYILCVFASNTTQCYFRKSLKGIGVPNLHLEQIRETLVPVPTKNEQIKIYEAVENLNRFIEMIEASLN